MQLDLNKIKVEQLIVSILTKEELAILKELTEIPSTRQVSIMIEQSVVYYFNPSAFRIRQLAAKIFDPIRGKPIADVNTVGYYCYSVYFNHGWFESKYYAY